MDSTSTTLLAKAAGLDLRSVNNWLDARSALAFQQNEFNRIWEAHAREALGECVCGKPGTHVFADDATDEWACRIPASALKPEVSA